VLIKRIRKRLEFIRVTGNVFFPLIRRERADVVITAISEQSGPGAVKGRVEVEEGSAEKEVASYVPDESKYDQEYFLIFAIGAYFFNKVEVGGWEGQF